MIVFWRLLLVYYILALFFYNRPFFAWRDKKPLVTAWVQMGAFLLLATGLLWPYLAMKWPFFHFFSLHGWQCVIGLSLLYVVNDRLFVFRAGQLKYHSLTFLAHDLMAFLLFFLASPLDVLYQTGNWVADSWTVFAVGGLVVSKMFSVFIYMVEQDIYGRDYPTIDESFVTMLMRLVFYLIVLLPGWRWVAWFLVWLWACQIARKNRLLDFSRFSLYFGILGATAVGFLAKWSFYWK